MPTRHTAAPTWSGNLWRMRMAKIFLLALAAAVAVTASAAPTEVARGVFLVRGEFVPGHQPDGNSVLFTAPKGLIVFDTGRHRQHTQLLIDFAAQRKTPLTDIINSHWHLDHTGGNLLLRERFPEVRIHASGAINDALGGFLANYADQLKEAIAKSPAGSDEVPGWQDELKLIASGDKLAPDDVIVSSAPRRIAGRTLDVHLEKNVVTAGDIWIFDPSTKVLVAGDLVTLPFPFLDTACPAHWKEALHRLGKVKFRLLIPGHGSPMIPAAFSTYRNAFDRLLECSASTETVAACSEGWIADAGDLLEAKDHDSAGKLAGYYIENVLRAPAEQTTKLCGE
ncbi:MAG: MBL fold metallo-hydrolase [Acidobacteriota bacterium]